MAMKDDFDDVVCEKGADDNFKQLEKSYRENAYVPDVAKIEKRAFARGEAEGKRIMADLHKRELEEEAKKTTPAAIRVRRMRNAIIVSTFAIFATGIMYDAHIGIGLLTAMGTFAAGAIVSIFVAAST